MEQRSVSMDSDDQGGLHRKSGNWGGPWWMDREEQGECFMWIIGRENVAC